MATNDNNLNESILDIILEKTSNIERASNDTSIKQASKVAIKEQARFEGEYRAKMLTFLLDKGFTREQILDKVGAFVKMAMTGPIMTRASKEELYVQMSKAIDKVALLDYIKMSPEDDTLKKTLKPPVSPGIYYQRLPVKLEANNVPPRVKIDKVKQIIDTIIDKSNGAKVISIKDGKPHKTTQVRTISLKVNGLAFVNLCVELNGIIPYEEDDIKSNLYLRINCRPWQCGDCFAIGYHPKCSGKYCIKCGSNEHMTKSCKKKTKYCRNCHKSGHRSKDLHCPKYLSEIAKEIRKFDFPVSYLQDHEQMAHLIKHLQLK